MDAQIDLDRRMIPPYIAFTSGAAECRPATAGDSRCRSQVCSTFPAKTLLFTHSAVVTAANVHDKHPLTDLLHGAERRVYGDSAYASEKSLI